MILARQTVRREGRGCSARRLVSQGLDTYHLGLCSSQRMCFNLQVPQLRGVRPFRQLRENPPGGIGWDLLALRERVTYPRRDLLWAFRCRWSGLIFLGIFWARARARTQTRAWAWAWAWAWGEMGKIDRQTDRPMRWREGPEGVAELGYLTTSLWQSVPGSVRVRTPRCNRYAQSRAVSKRAASQRIGPVCSGMQRTTVHSSRAAGGARTGARMPDTCSLCIPAEGRQTHLYTHSQRPPIRTRRTT